MFQAVHKLTPEHLPENLDRQEESLLRIDPPGVVRSQTSGGNHAVDVRMMLEFLVPGVQDAEETDLGAEALRALAWHFGQCRLRHELKETA